MKNKLFLATFILAGVSMASAQTTLGPVVSSDLTLPAGSEWYIDGVTYVAPGATLTIQPGVTIYANDAPGANASALIVTSGASINAVGTPESPIVFTSIQARTVLLDHNDVGLWGGVILLGDARINADSADLSNAGNPEQILTNQIEGLTAIGRHGLDPSVELSYLTYGGDNDGHNGGTLKYVSIRHTGDSISGEDGDEIQGLTLGGVGSGTTLEDIEIFVSDDDGIEIFGGTVNLKNIVLAYAADDTLDLDQGYRGMGQNIVIIQNKFTDIFAADRDADKGGEWDGADSPEDNFPRAGGVFSNMTFVAKETGSGTAIKVRNAGIYQVWNSVFLDYSTWLDLDTNPSNGIVEDAVQAGSTAFVGNIFESATATGIDSSIIKSDFVSVDAVGIIANAANKNMVTADAGIELTRDLNGKVILGGPAAGSPVLNSVNVVDLPANGFFSAVDYVGAFDGVMSWAAWTYSANQGYLSVPGWITTDTYGNIYTPSGMIGAGQWVFSENLAQWIYIGSESDGGGWIYLVK